MDALITIPRKEYEELLALKKTFRSLRRQKASFAQFNEAKKTIDPQALRDYSSGTIRNEKVFKFLENI